MQRDYRCNDKNTAGEDNHQRLPIYHIIGTTPKWYSELSTVQSLIEVLCFENPLCAILKT